MKMNPLNTMKAGQRFKALIMLIAFGVLFTGCASQTKTIPKAGFLTDYSMLKKAEGEDTQWPADWTYVKEGVDWKAYDKIIVDRVTYFFAEDADYKGITVEDFAGLASYFNEQYIRILEKDYTLTDKPGPNTLRIRTAITGLKPNEPVIGTITTIVPVGLGLSAIKKATTGTHIGMGEAAGEAEVVDSQTGEVLAAGIDEKATGKKYRIDKTITKWGQVEEVTKMWAENLARHLKYVTNQQQ
jgi:hypothetical protein